MKSIALAPQATRVAVRTPPFFLILCLVIWAAALAAAFTHPGAIAGTDAVVLAGL